MPTSTSVRGSTAALARPRRLHRPPSILGVIRASADNNLELWSEEAYELDWMERHFLFRHVVVANNPAAVRHVLLENHSNYEKTRIARNLLEPGLGRGLTVVHPGIADLLGLPQWIPRSAIWRGRSAVRGFEPVISRLMDSRKKPDHPGDGERSDLLTLLMKTRDAETGQSMSEVEIRAQIATIFAAGHETTAMAVIWAVYLLGMHPWADEAMQSELNAVLKGTDVRWPDVARLTYARQVFEETLRLYPPVHTIARRAIADDVVVGHRVRAGTDVIISPWLLQRHRKLWQDPERFQPARFAAGREEQRDRFAYLPFGAGPRICIGQGFAMMEGILILTALMRRWRLEVLSPEDIEPVGLITLRPRAGLRVRVEARS
jgi:cytochrome P450